MRTIIVIHIRSNFHKYRICGCDVKSFQSFSYQFYGPFLGGVSGPYSHKHFRYYWTFDQRLSPIRKMQCFKIPLKFYILAQMWLTQSSQFGSIFGNKFDDVKLKILLKTKFFSKNYILKNTKGKSHVPEKSQNSCKIKQKTPSFWHKLPLNCPLGQHQRVIKIFHLEYNRTIRLYFLDVKFQVLSICRSRLHPEKATTFF